MRRTVGWCAAIAGLTNAWVMPADRPAQVAGGAIRCPHERRQGDCRWTSAVMGSGRTGALTSYTKPTMFRLKTAPAD